MIKKNNYKNGFSLAEILISLLIVSVILAAITPVLLKRAPKRIQDGVIFTYSENNTVEYDDEKSYCYQTFSDIEGQDSYAASNQCSEYEYIISEGINRVNLTLVGGGGGGGGNEGSYNGIRSAGRAQNSLGNGFFTTAVEWPYYSEEKVGEIRMNVHHVGQAGLRGGADGDYCKAGDGGASSAAIYNFIPSFNVVNGEDYLYTLEDKSYSREPVFNPWSVIDNDGSSFDTLEEKLAQIGLNTESIGVQNGDKYSLLIFTSSVYGIKMSPSGEYSLICKTVNPSLMAEACKFNKDTYIESVKGTPGQKILKSSITEPVTAYGGLGARTKASNGGNGETVTFTSNTCAIGSGIDYPRIYSGRDQGLASASYTYTSQEPGRMGGGGAPGAMIRFVGIDVTPGDKLHIVVGKGGEGGKHQRYHSEISDGKGGTSSAVYLNGNLIAMVNGGAGGFGGNVVITHIGSCYVNNSGRNQAKVFFPSNSTLPNLASNLVTTFSYKCRMESTNKPNSDLSLLCLNYSALNKEPYATLNKLTGTYHPSGVRHTYDGVGALSNFSAPSLYQGLSISGCYSSYDDPDERLSTVLYSDVTYKDDIYRNIYDGLYHRSLIKTGETSNTAGYVGGLGGFSGFGGKAGCGAYFQGNFDGRDNDGNKFAAMKGKFILNEQAYDVNKYYDNCTTVTPNGASATFVMPDPKNLTFGQAGAGGGGGGYAYGVGPGDGGKGQDGYVMIDWLK